MSEPAKVGNADAASGVLEQETADVQSELSPGGVASDAARAPKAKSVTGDKSKAKKSEPQGKTGSPSPTNDKKLVALGGGESAAQPAIREKTPAEAKRPAPESPKETEISARAKAPVVPPVPEPSSAEAQATRAADAVRRLRRQRAFRLAAKLAAFVLLPTLISTVYYLGLASHVYESTSLFTIQSAEANRGVGLDAFLGVLPSSPGTKDALAVRDFILSRDMLQRLVEEHDFSARFQGERFDSLSRLDDDASFEDAYQYFLSRVTVEHHSTSDVLQLTVQGYSADDATEFAQAIIGYSEKKVNDLSQRARQDQIAFAKAELQVAEARLSAARKSVLELQAEHAEFNPAETASETLTVRGQLQAALAKARTELTQARAYMSPQASKVIALQQEVNALQSQIRSESQRLVGKRDDDGLNTSIASFEGAILEKEFAQGAYRSALTSLELARADAGRQHRYLAVIAKPSRADEATLPKPHWGILTVFLVSLMAFGVTSLFWASVREHARF